MAENTKIEWCDHTVNLWWGCHKVHTGCKNCYAKTLSNRWGNDIWGKNKQRKRIRSAFSDLSKYQKQAEKENKIVKVFIGSMMDIFEESKPLITNGDTGVLRQMLFSDISDGKYPNLIFLLLTKRPENIAGLIPIEWLSEPPKNVWFGTSISDAKTFNELVPKLIKNKGNKFLSIEPQIGIINSASLFGIDWVIQGGESGNKKRPFNLDWAYSMQTICRYYEVPFFFKQIDKVQEIPTDLTKREFPNFESVGKNILDIQTG